MQIDNGMTPAVIRSKVQEARTQLFHPSMAFITGATVFAAVVFNFVLALLNANVLALSRGHVIMAEVIIIIAAIAICAISFNRLMTPWVVVCAGLAILFITLSLFRESIEAKYFRDVLIIPVFIALGLTFAKGNIVKLFMTIQVAILAVMILEAISPNVFGNTVNPMMYYMNTRDVAIEAFWNKDSLLYFSAFRPPAAGRFIPFIDALLGSLRLSSVFLEPVSMGNWCTVISIFIIAFWQNLSRKEAIFFVLTTIAMLIGSDGRLATVTIILIIIMGCCALILPRYSYFWYLPGAIVGILAVVAIFDPPLGDDFLGRLALSERVLAAMDMLSVMGLDSRLTAKSPDSGISYLILSQSVIGTAILWASICFLQPARDRMTTVFMHGICLYIALVLTISFSLFSIKTAGPLWFLYGYVRARNASIS